MDLLGNYCNYCIVSDGTSSDVIKRWSTATLKRKIRRIQHLTCVIFATESLLQKWYVVLCYISEITDMIQKEKMKNPAPKLCIFPNKSLVQKWEYDVLWHSKKKWALKISLQPIYYSYDKIRYFQTLCEVDDFPTARTNL